MLDVGGVVGVGEGWVVAVGVVEGWVVAVGVVEGWVVVFGGVGVGVDEEPQPVTNKTQTNITTAIMKILFTIFLLFILPLSPNNYQTSPFGNKK
jgi:hypothetical protein